MKRQIHAATSIDKYLAVAETVDHTKVNNDAARFIVDADKSGMLETFAYEVTTSGLIISGDELIPDPASNYGGGDILARYSLKPLRKGQTTDTEAWIQVFRNERITFKQAAQKLVAKMRRSMNYSLDRYSELTNKSILQETYNNENAQLISAFSVACRYVKKYAGLIPVFRYSDSGTAQYVPKGGSSRESAFALSKPKFERALEQFEADTGVRPRIYIDESAWASLEFRVSPKIQLVHNKKADTYSQV